MCYLFTYLCSVKLRKMKISNSQIFWESLGFIVQICIGVYEIELLAVLHIIISVLFLGFILYEEDMPLNIMITYMGVIFVILAGIYGLVHTIDKHTIKPFNQWLDKLKLINSKEKTKNNE